MKFRHILMVVAAFVLVTTTSFAGVSPEARQATPNEFAPALGDKAFGDPTDFLAAAAAAADYIRYMQADITEDNAGNGPAPGDDPQDAGWNWSTTDFFHNGTSSGNLTGVIANSVFDVYELTGDAALRTVLDDVATQFLLVGPDPAYPVGLHYAGDMMFLLRYAELPGVVNPQDYRDGAVDVWNWRLNNTGTGTAVSVAEAIRDGRAGQGYQNGIIPWDVAPYVEAVMMLDAAFPGNGYAADAAAMAEVLWQDSFNLVPGYFDFDGRCKGYDPTGLNKDYWWYALGVSGLIQAFTASGTHLGDLALLETRLLECQYADGAFGDWSAPTDVNTRDWQSTAYAVAALTQNLPQTAVTGAATYDAGVWLASTQDVSGGFVYSSGTHYPEIGAECAMALAFAVETAGSSLVASASGPDPVACGETKTVTVDYLRNIGTPGLRGYEITFEVVGAGVTFDVNDIDSGGALAAVGGTYFNPVAVGGNVYTVNEAILGATPGLLADGALFTVDLATVADGLVEFNILSYKLRDPDNGFMFADLTGTSFTVDCTVPNPVTDITADPGHNKILVDWNHDGLDVVYYEVYRGLWHDGTPGNSAYPEYDDVNAPAPPRPADRDAAVASNEWELAGTVLAGTTDFVDTWLNHLDRGIYSYEVYAVDAVGYVSANAPTNDWATNYWLGDVWGGDAVSPDPDGEVLSFDINVLGAAFATVHGGNDYNNECDVGPTDDWGPFGIPLTDDVIDFEDLMVFAMNFNVVGPAKSQVPGGLVSVMWRDMGEGVWALELTGGSGLKGLHVSADLPAGAVRPGDLLAGREVFLTNAGDRLDVNLAVLGQGAAFQGTGTLFTVVTAVDPTKADIDARGVTNEKLAVDSSGVGGGTVPAAFRLVGNHPNPFNPMTKISFAVPADGPVVLAIYSLDGRRIRTLLNERRTAGEHEVTWDGRDDGGRAVSSGSYLYRLEAGRMSQVKKMTLMK